MPQPHLTPMEKMVLELYDASEYLNDPGDSIWTQILSDDFQRKGGYQANQFPGVVSSLVKKGLVGTQGEGRDQTIWRRL